MKLPRRDDRLHLRFTEAEMAVICMAAQRKGILAGTYAREAVVAKARRDMKPRKAQKR